MLSIVGAVEKNCRNSQAEEGEQGSVVPSGATCAPLPAFLHVAVFWATLRTMSSSASRELSRMKPAMMRINSFLTEPVVGHGRHGARACGLQRCDGGVAIGAGAGFILSLTVICMCKLFAMPSHNSAGSPMVISTCENLWS